MKSKKKLENEMVPNYQNSKEISLKAGWVQVHPTRGSTLIFFFLNSKQREEKLRDERQSLRASAWGETLHLLRFFFLVGQRDLQLKKKLGVPNVVTPLMSGVKHCNDLRGERSTGKTITFHFRKKSFLEPTSTRSQAIRFGSNNKVSTHH